MAAATALLSSVSQGARPQSRGAQDAAQPRFISRPGGIDWALPNCGRNTLAPAWYSLKPGMRLEASALDGVATFEPVLGRNLTEAHLDVEFTTGRCNQTGLNGLQSGGTDGLDTGVFTVSAVQPIQYTIQEVDGLFDINNETLCRGVVPGSFPFRLAAEPTVGPQRRLVIIDDNVFKLFGDRIEKYFTAHDIDAKLLVLPTNEANKSFDLVYSVARAMEDFKLNRRKEPCIAIGGGVCLDVAGLACNLYRRNTPIIKVPTTVMAAVDASVGIKTAVNFDNKKNKLGTYCPPLAVFLDRAFLNTLDQRNLSNGSAEILKMACIKDAELFHVLEENAKSMIATNFQCAASGTAMRRSIQGMLEELEPNLQEHILERLVDYGHSFSPEIEMAALVSGDELLHGEAVNIDMALTTQMSYRRGYLTRMERDRVLHTMRALRLPFWHAVCQPALFNKGLVDTVKARDGQQRLPLMDGIGSAVFVNDVTPDEVAAAVADLRAIAVAMEQEEPDVALASIAPRPMRQSSNVVPHRVAVAA